MVVKVEIRSHDGLGRVTKIQSDEKVILSPNLLSPVAIPAYHMQDSLESKPLIDNITTPITLGYFPPLHKFSTFASEDEVLDIIKSIYTPKIKSLDFVSFPLDKASSLRTVSHYPDFILKASQLSDLNVGWIYSHSDSQTDWSNLNLLPLMIVGDLSTLYKNQRKTWSYLVEINKNYPLTLKYAPSIPPVLFPLFTYLGIDFFDSLYGQYMAQNNVFIDYDEITQVSDGDDFQPSCMCAACEQHSTFKTIKEWLSQHNQNFTESMIRKVQKSVHDGTLRDLVKKYVLIDPNSTALLRIADLDTENNLLEKFNPTLKRQKLLLTSNSDYIRPEIKMFHNRVKERFSIPEWTQAIILIPCSARKPYSDSRSHKLFASAIKSALRGKRYSLLELIITSPLGVVPRFFERVYPAGMYDIPVTGNWSELEQDIVEELLLKLFSQVSENIPIISYLAEPEKSIILKFTKKYPQFNITMVDLEESETSANSLRLLREHLQPLKDSIEQKGSKNTYELEFFKAMADYQFGKQAGDIIFDADTEIKRRGYVLTAFSQNKQLATLNMGNLALTILAASKLAEKLEDYKVYFADSTLTGSAIYTPGIVKADNKIRPEDAVLVMAEKTGQFLALGKSHLSGFELEQCSYGLGVSVKKKMK